MKIVKTEPLNLTVQDCIGMLSHNAIYPPTWICDRSLEGWGRNPFASPGETSKTRLISQPRDGVWTSLPSLQQDSRSLTTAPRWIKAVKCIDRLIYIESNGDEGLQPSPVEEKDNPLIDAPQSRIS